MKTVNRCFSGNLHSRLGEEGWMCSRLRVLEYEKISHSYQSKNIYIWVGGIEGIFCNVEYEIIKIESFYSRWDDRYDLSLKF